MAREKPKTIGDAARQLETRIRAINKFGEFRIGKLGQIQEDLAELAGLLGALADDFNAHRHPYESISMDGVNTRRIGSTTYRPIMEDR